MALRTLPNNSVVEINCTRRELILSDCQRTLRDWGKFPSGVPIFRVDNALRDEGNKLLPPWLYIKNRLREIGKSRKEISNSTKFVLYGY